MSKTRSILLVGLGIALGSVATSLIFYSLQPHSQDENSTLVDETLEEETDRPTLSQSYKTVPFTRDISGKGILRGVVKNQDGVPVAKALVRIHLTDQPWTHEDPPNEARTDSSGNFAIKDLNEDLSYQVWAMTPGSAVASKKYTRCGSPVELILEEGASIKLIFVGIKDSSRKIRVQLAGTNLWPIREYQTDSNEPLTISGLKEGEYFFWIESGNQAYISDSPLQLQKGDEESLEIELTQATTTRVKVLDQDGKPVGVSSSITVKPSATGLLSKTIFSNEDGQALIGGLVPGNYSVLAGARGYAQPATIPLHPGVDATITLERGSTLKGFVRTDSGEPIQGASLAIDQGFGGAVVSLPMGVGRQFTTRMTEAAGTGWPRLIELEDAQLVTGPSRLPLPDIGSKGAPSISFWRTSSTNGSFSLDGLPSGQLVAWATHPDYVAKKKVNVTLEPGGNLDSVVIVMHSGTTLTARTVDERGFPLPESEIRTYRMGGELLSSTLSESDGFATIKGLPGSFRIEATSEDRIPIVKNIEGRTGSALEIELKLWPADKILYGRVLNPDGFGVENATITARLSGRGNAHVLTGTTADDGTFSLEGAGAQMYHVTAEHPELGAARLSEASHGENIKLVLNKNNNLAASGSVAPNYSQGFGATDSLGQAGFNQDSPSDSNPVPIQGGGAVYETVQTQFGEADQLTVTGPPSGKGGLPITMRSAGGKVVVKSVSPGSQVAEAGLSRGNRIIAIDGKKVTGVAAARKAISGKIGTIVMLKISGSDGPYTIVVQRVRVRAN